MKRLTGLFLFTVVATGVSAPAFAGVSACFTPGMDCEARAVSVIDSARRSVHVEAFLFTSKPILQALVAAKNRGADVRVILDKTNEKPSAAATFLIRNGIRPIVDMYVKTAHNKIIIADGATVVTGSFNFTNAAQTKNAENMVVISDAAIAGQYEANFKRRAAASIPFKVNPSVGNGVEDEQ